jgi:hypothetical protein
MPNHVVNRITFYDRIEEVLNFMKSDESEFDFNKLIPRPEIFDHSIVGMCTIHGVACHNPIKNTFKRSEIELVDFPDGTKGTADGIWVVYNGFEDLMDGELIEMVRPITQEDINEMGGYENWYDWCLDKWGTKWNAYNINVAKHGGECIIHFNTAWSTPEPIWLALSERFPDVEFCIAFSDEDTGSNVGYITAFNGSVSMDELSDTKEGYELAFELHPGSEEYYRLNDDGEYEYHEPGDESDDEDDEQE